MLDPNGLCGPIVYEASFDGTPLTTSSSPMTYDASTRTFEIYTEDENLAGTYTIIVTAYFANYPTTTKQN